MIGDFDDNANAMWSLHLGEAKSHDEARIHTLKDDMDSVLIFVRVYRLSLAIPFSRTITQAGLFSAALTSFLSDSTNSLQVDPAQQMVYYQQQNVALLAQISQQVSSIAPQVSISSAPPPPYPSFSPNPSDVRVNVFWFMSLIFSLFAALLATLVQQWVRDYMHVFQRYSNPLKSARLRQYLYEGAEGWYMPMVAESVPGLVHVSLFLFFIGLGDSLLAINTTVGITTIIPITLCGLLYVLSMFAPVLNPQSPFQNPFSGLIWYLKQKVHPRHYLDRASGGSLKAVSPNLSQGQAQLAMEENNGRKDRDIRAIRWLIDNRTEDDEMESFAIAIPGCFTSKWGIDVWRKVSEVKQYEDADVMPNDLAVGLRSDEDLHVSVLHHHHPPPFRRTQHRLSILHTLRRIFGIRIAPHDMMLTQSMSHLPSDSQAPNDLFSHQDLAIRDLCKRIRHLVITCENRSIFTNKELWLKRARGCAETAASLVFCAGIKPELFGDLEKLLLPLSQFLVMEFSQITAPGSDGLFMARFDCLAFVVVYRRMANHDGIKLKAHHAIESLSWLALEDDGDQTNNDSDDENALRNARRIDEYFETAREFCVHGLRGAFKPSEVGTTEEQVKEALARNHEADISLLERITPAADQVSNVDWSISRVNDHIYDFAGYLISVVRGVYFDKFETELLHPDQFFNPTKGPFFAPQFIFLHQRLRLLCSFSSALRDIIDGRSNGIYEEILKSLKTLWDEADGPNSTWMGVHRRHLMVRQLWRLQDLRDGGGFGFWVELFFPVAYSLGTIPLSPDNLSVLILGMFRTVTLNWRQHKHSIATQRVILNLICDLAIRDRGLFSNYRFPSYILEELLVLLGNMVEGQCGSHLDEATKELEDAIKKGESRWTEINLFRAKAVKVISRSRAPASFS